MTIAHSQQSRVVLTNVQPSHTGYYSLVVTNQAFFRPGVLGAGMRVFVCDDLDTNGIPDCWQQAYNLDPAQSGRDDDPDMDGVSNYDEFKSGTDPGNPESVLAFSGIQVESTNLVTLQFQAASNTSYTVQVKPSVTFPRWIKLTDVYAHETNRLATVLHPNHSGQSGFYRLVSPRIP